MCFYTGLGSILWVLCGLYYSTSFLVLLGQVHVSNAIVINLKQSSFFDVDKYSIHFCCFFDTQILYILKTYCHSVVSCNNLFFLIFLT